jgi:hypothetical protein
MLHFNWKIGYLVPEWKKAPENLRVSWLFKVGCQNNRVPGQHNKSIAVQQLFPQS